MPSAVRPFASRCSKSSSVTKITPALGALVKVAPSNPAKATALFTPGRASSVSVALRITASVRSRLAPGGSWKAVMK